LHAFGLATLAWHMDICYKVTRHLCVCTVVYPLPSHTYFWNAHIMTKITTFSLQGTLHDILGDGHCKVSNVMAFLHCTWVDKFI
jgi:hypothetical protein